MESLTEVFRGGSVVLVFLLGEVGFEFCDRRMVDDLTANGGFFFVSVVAFPDGQKCGAVVDLVIFIEPDAVHVLEPARDAGFAIDIETLLFKVGTKTTRALPHMDFHCEMCSHHYPLLKLMYYNYIILMFKSQEFYGWRNDDIMEESGGFMIKLNFKPEIDEKSSRRVLKEIYADPMGGWATLPGKVDMKELAEIKKAGKKIQEESEVLVCIGIGGSYLGHRAIIEALRPKSELKIVYAGNSLSVRELKKSLDEVGDADFSIVVISKSGTTLEPAVAFTEFKRKLVEKYGEKEAYSRIYATTDAFKGTLHDEAVANGYTRFVVPDNIGGRYSVLTAVGLLPLVASGVDVDELLAGASEGMKDSLPAIYYGYMRYALGAKGYDTEVFASFEPCTLYFNEWLKQLFGESEGKNKQGIFPASVIYSTDLHSMGQYMQDGRRNIFETIINYPTDENNAKVVLAVQKAHTDGGIPVLTIALASFDERGFGELIYFFELACAVSAKLSGVNPFDQPGVEAYKSELKKLLGA